MTAGPQPFLRRHGSTLVPEPIAVAPWAPDMLHGRLITALAARASELEDPAREFHCARLSVDLFRAATLEPLSVTTHAVRSGRRIRVIVVDVVSGGEPVARATALLLRPGTAPPVRPWQAPEWDAPAPDELAAEDTPESRFIPMETRSIVPGGYRAPGRKRLWLREQCALVEGEAWTPLTRVAAVADLTNALANTDEQPNHFINADVTVYLGRMPAGEWIGLDATGHVSAGGVATGSCDLYDTEGRCGIATVAALAAPAPLTIPETPPRARSGA